MSETKRYLHLTECHCYRGDGKAGTVLDIGSQGDTVVPWALSFDLPPDEFAHYCGGAPAFGTIHVRGHADHLPFDTDSFDTVYSSHLLEDFKDWEPILKEWVRVLKPGGKLVILVPDHERFRAAVNAGQPDNPNHLHEARVGELSEYADRLGVLVLEDRLTDLTPTDYSILFVASKR